MKFYIVSGLSGSGKSIALQALEDLGYYCIDNLPAMLLPQFAGEFLARSNTDFGECAVGLDSRNRGFLETLPQSLEQLAALGLRYKILFLEADESVLLKRFSETRRKHPLTDRHTVLIEGIRRERELLLPLYRGAARQIDTSHTTPHELRGLVRDFAGGGPDAPLTLLFESFGYKHGTPLDADFVFDVRCVPNPYWHPELRDLTGQDQAVMDYFAAENDVGKMTSDIENFIERWLPKFEAENRSYITVAIGCTGGRHRSVYIAERLVDQFQGLPFSIQVRHRELD